MKNHSLIVLGGIAAAIGIYYYWSNKTQKVAGTNVAYVTQTSGAGGVKTFSDGTSIDASGNYYDASGKLVWTAPQP